MKRFKHDCDECRYVGSMFSDRRHDLYAQWGEDILSRTVIARYGDEPFEYVSGIGLCHVNPALEKALLLAIEQGVIPEHIQYAAIVREQFIVGKFLPDNKFAVSLFFEEIAEEIGSEFIGEIMCDKLFLAAKSVFVDKWHRWISVGYIKNGHIPDFDFISNKRINSISLVWQDPRLSSMSYGFDSTEKFGSPVKTKINFDTELGMGYFK
jgi:hypothetical protein